MNDLLSYEVLSNSIRSWLICLTFIAFVFAIKKYLSRTISRVLFRLIRHSSWKIDQKSFVELLLQPMQLFLIVTFTMLALDSLNFPAILDIEVYHISFRRIVDGLAKGVFVVIFIWLLRRIIDFIAMLMEQRANLTTDTADNQMVVFFKDFFKAILVIIGILLVIRFSFNKNITTYLAGLSIVAGALALAARESLENLIASFIIFFDKPFHVGDLVKVQSITGTVEKIGLRSTRIRTDQKTFVTVPNKQMVDSIMDNLTLRTFRRADLKLEISLQTSSVKLDHAIAGIKSILSHPAIENYVTYLSDITGNAFLIHVEYYTGIIPVADFNQLKQTVNLDILRLLESLQVELAGEVKEVLIRS
ncbi:mechanosensitive ion channel family protein [Flavihumibacter petaseus]|uniref:MscS family protein n=1 Tax=Flavihumibacter petaseus NBRC 106054 TaxID=1220578 RepID=A0A0E9MW46_9BACT|nr:mechanosensitive ion channel domain-containing protein [Flavihumibacter petaseus]GAO41814.1 MscS family protein [Flavihumibacter petaseus NBRC 106054]